MDFETAWFPPDYSVRSLLSAKTREKWDIKSGGGVSISSSNVVNLNMLFHTSVSSVK